MKKVCIMLSLIMVCAISAGAEKVTLRINAWENPATTAALEDINMRFMKANPDVEIEFTHSPTANFNQENPLRVTAGDVDIWATQGFSWRVQEYHTGVDLALDYQNIEAGLVEPLDGQAFLANYTEDSIRDAVTYNGSVYGVCAGSVVFSGMFYNKDMFAQYGLSVPTTYDELLEVAEVLMENDIAPFTTGGAAVWPIGMMIHGFAGPLIGDADAFEKELWTGGPGWKNPKYMEALEKYQNLLLNYYEDGFQALEYNPHITRFTEGKVAMLPDGIWQATTIADAADFDFGYMPIPSSDNAEENTAFYGKYDLAWQVHSKSKNKDAALKWLEFFSRKDNYEFFINSVGWIPTQTDVNIESALTAEVAQHPIKMAFERIHVVREGQGKYADGSINHLVPVGTIETVEELVDLAMKDWEAAAK